MEGYGATECGPAMSLNTPLCYREGPSVVSCPASSGASSTSPESRAAARCTCGLEPDERLLLLRTTGAAPSAALGSGSGWYNTGDVVEVDDDGFVTMLGRVKRFAKIAGEMVSLELVERIAYASPQHKHAATVEQIKGNGESTVLFTTDPELDRLARQRLRARSAARNSPLRAGS